MKRLRLTGGDDRNQASLNKQLVGPTALGGHGRYFHTFLPDSRSVIVAAVERATLFKSGLNYLCVTESGFHVHLCNRQYDGNDHFTGHEATNSAWRWDEVDRLAFIPANSWERHARLYAWPATDYVPHADEFDIFRRPAYAWGAFKLDGWLVATWIKLTGTLRFHDSAKLLKDMTFSAQGNWRYLYPNNRRQSEELTWQVCGVSAFRRRQWRKIARAMHEYSSGRVELDASGLRRMLRQERAYLAGRLPDHNEDQSRPASGLAEAGEHLRVVAAGCLSARPPRVPGRAG